ncbi:hypothetical protein [Asaia platycodi]|uniref:hypothetical protein n=1 Tax=Asaia platycodi TaxID=610243 RepID=UPI000A3F7E8D
MSDVKRSFAQPEAISYLSGTIEIPARITINGAPERTLRTQTSDQPGKTRTQGMITCMLSCIIMQPLGRETDQTARLGKQGGISRNTRPTRASGIAGINSYTHLQDERRDFV